MGAIYHNGDYVGSVPPIDDSSVSDEKLWSSQKTKTEIEGREIKYKDVECAITTTSGGTPEFSTGLASTEQIISVSIVYNDAYYYFSNEVEYKFGFGIHNKNVIFRIGHTVTTNRTLVVRVGYK